MLAAAMLNPPSIRLGRFVVIRSPAGNAIAGCHFAARSVTPIVAGHDRRRFFHPRRRRAIRIYPTARLCPATL
jgi:hypothetical protein